MCLLKTQWSDGNYIVSSYLTYLEKGKTVLHFLCHVLVSLISSALERRHTLPHHMSVLSCLESCTLWPVNTPNPAAVCSPALCLKKVSAWRCQSLHHGRLYFLLFWLLLVETDSVKSNTPNLRCNEETFLEKLLMI